MSQGTYAEALVRALREVVLEDDLAVIIGGAWAGAVRDRDPVWKDFALEYNDRILYPPISENGLCGLAIGAAMGGLHPLVNLGMAGYAYNGWSQIANEAANISYMTSGRVKVPLLMHMFAGGRSGAAAQHTQHPESSFGNVPGLDIVCPAGVEDVGGLFKTAVKRQAPTLFMNNLTMLSREGTIPESIVDIPFGEARVVREGDDITLLAFSSMVQASEDAAETLAKSGISVEVIDPRTIVPFDWDTLIASVERTGRLVVAEAGQLRFGLGAEIAAVISQNLFGRLKAPILRVGIENCPIPAAPALKNVLEPSTSRIIETVLTAFPQRS